MFKIVLDWYISISIIIHRTLHVCLWIQIYLLVIKKNISYRKEISMQPLSCNILTQDSSPRIIYPNLVTCPFGLNTGVLWPRIMYPVPRGKNLFQAKICHQLTRPNKMATGREGLAPTDNQYLKKCIKEDITITLKFPV